MTAKPLPDLEAKVLLEFWHDAQDNEGWCRQGVRGWRFRGEIGDRVGDNTASSAIIRLKKLGFLSTVEIQSVRRDYLYRISSAGAHRIAPGQDFTRPRPAVRRDTFFIAWLEWTVLQAFREAPADRSLPIREGEGGWMTARELRPRANWYGGAAHATSVLARIGLVVQKRWEGDRTLYSRITAVGERLVIVDRQWSGAERIERVEVANPGEAPPARTCGEEVPTRFPLLHEGRL
jgi:hypothetical protein